MRTRTSARARVTPTCRRRARSNARTNDFSQYGIIYARARARTRTIFSLSRERATRGAYSFPYLTLIAEDSSVLRNEKEGEGGRKRKKSVSVIEIDGGG